MTATTAALGSAALSSLTTGTDNVAVGANSLKSTTGGTSPAGSQNVAVGSGAGSNNTIGAQNVLIGYNAAPTLVSGSSNIVIGSGADVPAGAPSTSNYLNIGNAITGSIASGGYLSVANTPPPGDTTTKIATTAFVSNAVSGGGGGGNQGQNTLIIGYELSSGTLAPSISATTWTTRSFNTIYYASGSLSSVTLSGGGFSLPAGTYIIRAQMPVTVASTASGGAAAARVYNNTNSTELVKGLTSISTGYGSGSGDYGACGMSNIDGTFVLTSTSTVYIQDYGKHGMQQGPEWGVGITSRNEVYGLANIIKIA